MFGVLPLEFEHKGDNRLPLANWLIIAFNVLIFLCGAAWVVGPGTGVFSVLLYGFSHAGFSHLLFNMWALYVFGDAVNRRVGNIFYAIGYLGTLVALGLFARLFSGGPVLGASGGVFAVIIVALMLMPRARLKICYFVVFPLSILFGLFRRPQYGIFWFFNGGTFDLRAVWALLAVPLLELSGMFSSWLSGGAQVWHLGHLLGLVCGVACVLLLPKRISMPLTTSEAWDGA